MRVVAALGLSAVGASVQPISAPQSWRSIYHEVERCAGMLHHILHPMPLFGLCTGGR